MTSKNCILCLDTTARTMKIFGRRGRSLNIFEIISKHFWFSPDKSNNFHKEICVNCWRKTKSFHEFHEYVRVAQLQSIAGDHLNVLLEIKEEKLESPGTETAFGTSDESLSRLNKNYETNESIVISKVESSYDDYADDFGVGNDQETEIDPANADADVAELELEGKLADFFRMQCDLCSEQAHSMDDVQQHFKSKHNVNRGYLRCDSWGCDNKKFKMRKAILDHVKWHSDPNAYHCTKCMKTFDENRRLAAHIEAHHIENDQLLFNCERCAKRYSKQHQLTEHVKRAHPPAGQCFTCDLCQKSYKTKKLLRQHIQTVHTVGDTKHICFICAKLLCSKYSLKDHLETHAEHCEM